uniref:Uncharacterized protein n=1 Tax=Colobus angolensis palliatus TaxID=336983 RepID=A0A2K5IMZ2_COLAP
MILNAKLCTKRLLLLDSKLPCPLYQWLTRHIGIYVILRGERELSLKKLETSILPS